MLNKENINRSPFTVPENYFEELRKELMNSLPEKEVQKTKKVTLWKKVLPWASIAAVVAVVAISLNIKDSHQPSMTAEQTDQIGDRAVSAQNLAYNDAEDYFLFMEEEVTNEDYMDVLFEEGI